MKTIIFTNWNPMRYLRLIFGLIALVIGIADNEYMLILAAAFILITAIFNVGCCGAAGCTIPQKKQP